MASAQLSAPALAAIMNAGRTKGGREVKLSTVKSWLGRGSVPTTVRDRRRLVEALGLSKADGAELLDAAMRQRDPDVAAHFEQQIARLQEDLGQTRGEVLEAPRPVSPAVWATIDALGRMGEVAASFLLSHTGREVLRAWEVDERSQERHNVLAGRPPHHDLVNAMDSSALAVALRAVAGLR